MQKKTAKILKRWLYGGFVTVFCTGATAQETTKPTLDSTTQAVISVMDTAIVPFRDTFFQKPHWAVGLTMGSNALMGLDVAYSINPMFNLKLGYNYLDLVYKDLTPVLKAINLPAQLSGEVTMAQSQLALTAEFTPTRSKKLRLAIGGVYFLKNEVSGKVFYNSDLKLNDMVIPAAEVGSMKGTYTTASKIAPYIGVGLGRTVPKKKFGLNLDLGAIYKGEPILDIEASGLLKGNESNEAILNRNFKPLQWYPVANLRLSMRLN